MYLIINITKKIQCSQFRKQGFNFQLLNNRIEHGMLMIIITELNFFLATFDQVCVTQTFVLF